MTRPTPGAYSPLITTGRPGGKPTQRPRFRVLINKSDWKQWTDMLDQVGMQSGQRLWDHLAFRADRPPEVGKVTRLKGRHMKGQDGWSGVHHYEVSGAGRVDFQFHPAFTEGKAGDPHPVVRIIRISMSSH